MTSSRPYLIRAVHEWIVDNGLTPYILVNAGMEGVEVPDAYVEEGKIVLNVSPRAVSSLSMGNEAIEFEARFAGAPLHITFPPQAVLAIYAKENGEGMLFGDEEGGDEPPPDDSGPGGSKGEQRPNLKVVK